MPKPIVADLHSHTTASDGELDPEALVDRALEAGLETLAVTDHDTVGGVERAVARGKERGLEVIPGCELTIYEHGMELHLLSLFIDPHAKAFDELLGVLRERRKRRAFDAVKQLNAAGYAITDSDILEAAAGAESIGRPHIGLALARRGHAPSAHAAMSKFLGRGKVGYVEKYRLSPADAFRIVHAAGGIALLAHPGLAHHDELIAPFFRLGMDGIEAIYPSHSEVNRRFYAGLSRRYEKLICGGSDFHGPRLRPQNPLACAGVDRAILNELRRAADRYRADCTVAPVTRP